jgi:REP element-mobilizing transposase RayT
MPRLARLVVPGLPHHVTQRGNRRQQTFFCEEDYAAYVELMADWCKERVFVDELERMAGRILHPQKASRPLKLLKHPSSVRVPSPGTVRNL